MDIIKNNTSKTASSYYQSPAGKSTASTAPTDMSTTPINNHNYNYSDDHQQHPQNDNNSNTNNDYETTKVLLDYRYGNDDEHYDNDNDNMDNENNTSLLFQYEEEITYGYENDDDEEIIEFSRYSDDDTNFSNDQYTIVQHLNGNASSNTEYRIDNTMYNQKYDYKSQSQNEFQNHSHKQNQYQPQNKDVTERVVYNRHFTNITFIIMVTVIICIHILGYTIDQKLFYNNSNTTSTSTTNNNNHIASQWFTIMWSFSISLISSSLPVVVLWDTNIHTTINTNTSTNTNRTRITIKPIRILLSSIILVIWTFKIITTLLLYKLYYSSSFAQEQQLQRIDNTINSNNYDIILWNNSFTVSSRCIEWMYMTFIMILVIGPYTLGLTSSTVISTKTGTGTTNTSTQTQLLYIDVSKRTIKYSVIVCIFGFIWSLLRKVIIHPKYSNILLDYVTNLFDDDDLYILNFFESNSGKTNTSNVLPSYFMKLLFISPIVSDLFIYIGICTMNSPSLIEYHNNNNNTSTSSISSSAVDFIDEEQEVDEEEFAAVVNPNKRSTSIGTTISYLWTIRRRVLSNCMAIVLFILLSQYNTIVIPNNHVLHWYITGQYYYYNNYQQNLKNYYQHSHSHSTITPGSSTSSNSNNSITTTHEVNEQLQQKYDEKMQELFSSIDIIIESVHSSVVDNKYETPSDTQDKEQYTVSNDLTTQQKYVYHDDDGFDDRNKSSYDVYGIDDSNNIDTSTTTTTTATNIPIILEDDKDDDSQKVLENQDQMSTTTSIDTNKNNEYQYSYDDADTSPADTVSIISSSSTDKYEAAILTPQADDDDDDDDDNEIVATTLLGSVDTNEVVAKSIVLSVDEESGKLVTKELIVSLDKDFDETVTESIVPDRHNNDYDKEYETIAVSNQSVHDEEMNTVAATSSARDTMESSQQMVNNDIATTTNSTTTIEDSTEMDTNAVEEKELDPKLETKTMIEMTEVLTNDDDDSEEDTLTTKEGETWFGFGIQHQEEEPKNTIQDNTRTTTVSVFNDEQEQQETIKLPTKTITTTTTANAVIDVDIGIISNFTMKELLVTIILGGTYIVPVATKNDPTIHEHTTIESFYSFQPVVKPIVNAIVGMYDNYDDDEYEYEHDYDNIDEKGITNK